MGQITIMSDRGITKNQFDPNPGLNLYARPGVRCFFAFPNIDITGLQAKVSINIKDLRAGVGNPLILGVLAAPLDITTITADDLGSTVYTKNLDQLSDPIEITATQLIVQNGLSVRVTADGSGDPNIVFHPINATLSPSLIITIPDATVSNLAINQIDADVNILASWTATNNKYFEFQALQNGVVVYSASGTTLLGVTIPYNTLNSGETVFRVRTGNGIAGNILWSSWLEKTQTLTKKMPSVSTLEPSEVNQNINLPIIVSWTSANQSTFKLTVDGNIYTGTTAKTLTIPSNTLASGAKTMTLEITYIPVFSTNTLYHRKTTKAANFLAFGNPPTPTLLNKAIISTATPLIKWDSAEQVAYEFKLLDGMSNIEVTGEVLSTSKQYQVIAALENNKLYNLKLRVKNQYGLWSEYATSTFTTSFVVPNTPIISGFANIANGSIVLNVATETSAEYKNTEIWRKEVYGEWVRMAYNLSELDTWVDNYVRSATIYEYKARSIGQTGGIAESDAIYLSTTVKGYNFYNVEDLSKNISFKYNSEVVPTYKRNEAITIYAGTNAPSYETDKIVYQSLSMKFDTLNITDIDKLIALIRDTKLFLYKDSKGRKVFGQIVGDLPFPTTTNGVTTITFTFMQLSFLEQDVYAGDNTGLKLLMWDGTWMFDGTYAFGGA